MTRREIFLIVAITLLGAALRFFQIGAQSLWLDELFSVAVARRDWAQVIIGAAQGDTNPPLYHLFLYLAMRFGSDETAARFVSLFFGIAAIPLLYGLARQLFDTRIAQFASAMLAVNPLFVFYSQEARMYTQLVCFAGSAMFFFDNAWRTGRTWSWAGFTIAMTLAFYTHSLAVLNLIALDIFVLTQRDLLCGRWRALTLAHIAIVLLFVPWLVVSIQQAIRVQSGFWSGLPSPAALVMTIYLFFFSNVLPAFVLPFALFIGLALFGFAAFASVRAIRSRGADAASLVLAWCIFLVPVVLLYLLSFLRPIFVERTLLPASLGLYLLAAWALGRAKPRALNAGLGAAAILLMVIATLIYHVDSSAHKPAMRQAANALALQFQTNDVIAHTSDSSALAFMYYQPNLPHHFLAGDPDYLTQTTRGLSGRVAGLNPEDWQAIIAGRSRLWLVVALDHNSEYQKSRVAEADKRWARLDLTTVQNISFILYGFE